MAVDDSVQAAQGPFTQFVDCVNNIDCQYKNNSGKCIYETCIYNQEHPPTMTLMSFKCEVCDESELRDPRLMKIRICDNCIDRMIKAEKKPFTCVFCSRSQSSNSKIFLSGICDHCFDNLQRSINCKNCGNTP